MVEGWEDGEIADLEDEYEMLGEIGRGASAVVFRARDRALGRLVAIKVVRPHSIASGDDALKRLAREARTVARLQHPNIVTVFAVKRLTTGGLALVMQLVPGRTLKQEVQEHGPLSPQKAESILRDVAAALAFAHSQGVIHRDVKPENIFLDSATGSAMLSDFGIAHTADSEPRLTMTGAAIGTPAYMAPEQIDGAPADTRSDVYSLGLVTWEMLTGMRPWEGESLYNVISKQKQEDLPSIDSIRPGVVPPKLQYMVERMLQKRPAARWAGADAVLAKLDHWVLPDDWNQWEAAHKKRREAARSARADARKADPNFQNSATIKFRRPSERDTPKSLSVVTGAVTKNEMSKGATPSSSQESLPDTIEDQPSWVIEVGDSLRKKRKVRAIALVLAFLTVGSGLVWSELNGYSNLKKYLYRTSVVAVSANDEKGLPPATDLSNQISTPENLADREAVTEVMVLQEDSAVRLPIRRRVVQVDTTDTARTGSEVPSVTVTDDPSVVAAGGRHSCLLISGKAMCWGANDQGQLGDGDVESKDRPVNVAGELQFTHLSAGLAHSCGITQNGEAYCWGADDKGQLGDATTTSRSAPVRVVGSFVFRKIRTGANHTCALAAGGVVACWGNNSNGQVGDGSATMKTAPVRVGSDMRFVSVTAGWNHSCALAFDGSAWCWGANADGQLGDGMRADRRTPVPVAGGKRFTSISAGGNHTCAVNTDAEIMCWGSNTYGQLGTGNTTSSSLPVLVSATGRFASISSGGVHTCSRTTSGQIQCWGRNVYGQLGDGSNVDRHTPVKVEGSSSYSAVNATGAHTCARSSNGDTSCWGFNIQGQLGDGSRNHLSKPSRVTIPSG